MKYTTGFFLACCLLILTSTTGCSSKQGGEPDPNLPVPEIEEIDEARLNTLIKEGGKPFTLVNFYATWCKPCRVELPELVEIAKDPNSKVNLVLISLDEEEIVKNNLAGFLQEYHIDFTSYVKTTGEERFIRSLYPQWAGTIPLNLVYDQKGNLLEAMPMTGKSEIEMLVRMHETI